MVSPATCMVGRSSARGQRPVFSSDRTGTGKAAARSSRLVGRSNVSTARRRVFATGGFQIREQVAETHRFAGVQPRLPESLSQSSTKPPIFPGRRFWESGEHHGRLDMPTAYHQGIVGATRLTWRIFPFFFFHGDQDGAAAPSSVGAGYLAPVDSSRFACWFQ